MAHPRTSLLRAVTVILCSVLVLAGCTFGPDKRLTQGAEALANSLHSGDWPAPQQKFGAEVDLMFSGMDQTRPEVRAGRPEVDDELAIVPMHFTWLLPTGVWEYTTEVTFNRDDEGAWKPSLDPSVAHPSLNQNLRLAHVVDHAPRSNIVTTGGEQLTEELPVMRLGLDKGAVDEDQVELSATAIAEVLDIDPEPFVEKASRAGPKAFVEALVVRGNEPQTIPSQFEDIAGAAGHPETRLLTNPRGFADELLGRVGPATAEQIEQSDGRLIEGQQTGQGGLQERYDEQLAGADGVRVVAVGRDSGEPVGEPLFAIKPRDGKDLPVALDKEMQERAEAALEPLADAAAIAAIRPSTGEVVALANSPGAAGSQIANSGRYPPGSTFKVVTALALLRQGMTPESPVECPETTQVDGREFKNYDDFPTEQLGRTTLREAIAHSCNTAMIEQHDQLSAADLQEAAASLGMGVDHDVGFPAYFGEVPEPDGAVGISESIIGQGQIQSSPLAMAAVAASVQRGQTVIPELIPERGSQPTGPPLTEAEAGQLRELMAAVVTEGSATSLQGMADGAKTGTAEYGTEQPPKTHAWLIAHGNDLAVAAWVQDGDSGSTTAGPLVEAMLR